MNVKEEMLNIIREAKDEIIAKHYKMYDYVSIPEKKKKLLLKFDPYLDIEDFVALYAISPGILFTVDGLYIDDAFTKKFINYSDFKGVSKRKGFVDDFIINTESSGFFTFSEILLKNTGAEALEKLLHDLKAYSLSHRGLHGSKKSGKVEKRRIRLSKDEMIRCNAVIHTAAVAAAVPGAGLAQIPTSDATVIVPIQITMIIGLGAIFGIKITEGAASGIIKAFASIIAGRAISQVLVGWIPGAGNIINATTAAGITQAIGWYSASTFKTMAKSPAVDKQEGFVKASREYEQKLRNQAAEFIANKEVWENQRNELIELINDYAKLLVEYEIKAAEGDKKAAEDAEVLKAEIEILGSLPIREG